MNKLLQDSSKILKVGPLGVGDLSWQKEYFEGGTKILEKYYRKGLFISKSLENGVENDDERRVNHMGTEL